VVGALIIIKAHAIGEETMTDNPDLPEEVSGDEPKEDGPVTFSAPFNVTYEVMENLMSVMTSHAEQVAQLYEGVKNLDAASVAMHQLVMKHNHMLQDLEKRIEDIENMEKRNEN
jgi:hypothetical protein